MWTVERIIYENYELFLLRKKNCKWNLYWANWNVNTVFILLSIFFLYHRVIPYIICHTFLTLWDTLPIPTSFFLLLFHFLPLSLFLNLMKLFYEWLLCLGKRGAGTWKWKSSVLLDICYLYVPYLNPGEPIKIFVCLKEVLQKQMNEQAKENAVRWVVCPCFAPVYEVYKCSTHDDDVCVRGCHCPKSHSSLFSTCCPKSSSLYIHLCW